MLIYRVVQKEQTVSKRLYLLVFDNAYMHQIVQFFMWSKTDVLRVTTSLAKQYYKQP